MKYLLDSDTLIRAKNDFYPFDSCPGFWSWIEHLNKSGIAFSVDGVKGELIEEGDQLSNWAKLLGGNFFLKTDGGDVQKAIATIVTWVQAHEAYTVAARQEFFSSRGDLLLIGYALANGCTIVTFEKNEPYAKGRIKIPSVCDALGVTCIDLYRFLKAHPMKLVLQTASN